MSKGIITPLTHKEFGELFKKYKARFVVIANGYVRDTMVAEDIVTDSFIAVWNQRYNLAHDTNLPAYLMTTVKNRCLNWLKSHEIHNKAHQNIHSTHQRIRNANIQALEECNPEKLFADEIIGIIRKEVENMPELMRGVFVSSRVHNNTYEEISSKYNIPVRRVEYEIKKALQILQKALKDYFPAIAALLIISGLN